MKNYMIYGLIGILVGVSSSSAQTNSKQNANEYLLDICEKHYKDHLQRNPFKNRRYFEAGRVKEALQEEVGSLPREMGHKDITEFCEKNYKK